MWQVLKDDIRAQQALLDEETRKWLAGYARQGGKITCGKGCRECCNLTVNCTFTEALCVAETLTGEQAGRVREHAALLLEHIHEATDLKSYLRLHRQRIGFCPFLDADGACAVYAGRPFSCRSLLATKENRWCGADFSQLSSEEKRSFVESLDTTVTAFPLHYVAATQELGREQEARAARMMARQFGFSISGNFPFLIFLEQEYQLSKVIARGAEATAEFLEKKGLDNRFLITIDS
jgi:Fe-S-cluster containining protein